MWIGNQLGIVAKDDRRNRPGALFAIIGSYLPNLARPVFCAVGNRAFRECQLDSKSVAKMVQRFGVAPGLDPVPYGGESLCAAFAKAYC